jgi:hypothetical protein
MRRQTGSMTINFLTVLPSCGGRKGARQAVSNPETGESVLLYHPRHQAWTEHFAWSDDSTRLVGLTPVGRTTMEALHINRPQMTRLRGLWITLGLFPPR